MPEYLKYKGNEAIYTKGCTPVFTRRHETVEKEREQEDTRELLLDGDEHEETEITLADTLKEHLALKSKNWITKKILYATEVYKKPNGSFCISNNMVQAGNVFVRIPDAGTYYISVDSFNDLINKHAEDIRLIPRKTNLYMAYLSVSPQLLFSKCHKYSRK